VQGVTPVLGIRMRERASTSVPILESGGVYAPYCAKDCQSGQATSTKMKLDTAYDPQREILFMHVAVGVSMHTNTSKAYALS
jgi:hypothetical protein